MIHTVAIVEDDTRLRDTFARAIKSNRNLLLAGIADDFPEGLEILKTIQPDVLLVDIDLPNGSGLDLIRYAAAHLPQCGVMVITIFAEESLVINCIEAGAVGYLLKDSNNTDIVEQIHILLGGGSPLTPSIARRLLKRFTALPDYGIPKPQLSNKELLVLQMSAKGYNYDEIANLLELSRHTIGTFVKRTYQKLQVHSKTEAIFEARKLGLVHE